MKRFHSHLNKGYAHLGKLERDRRYLHHCAARSDSTWVKKLVTVVCQARAESLNDRRFTQRVYPRTATPSLAGAPLYCIACARLRLFSWDFTFRETKVGELANGANHRSHSHLESPHIRVGLSRQPLSVHAPAGAFHIG